jgi:hypothetical protein
MLSHYCDHDRDSDRDRNTRLQLLKPVSSSSCIVNGVRTPRTFTKLEGQQHEERLGQLLQKDQVKFLSLEKEYSEKGLMDERAYITPVDASSDSFDLLKFYSFSEELMRTLFVPKIKDGVAEFPLVPDEHEHGIICMNRSRDASSSGLPTSLSSIILIGKLLWFWFCIHARAFSSL